MHTSKLKQISLAVCFALAPLSSYAAGLGKLNVSSGIGEPLKAEIELLSVTPEELSTLAASIGSEEAYAQQGISRLGIHSNINVEVAKNSDGAPVLRLRSSQPVSDPYLDMLVQVDWSTGRLQREYTILLDPPGYKLETNNATPVNLPVSAGASSDAAAYTNNNLATVETSQASSKKTKKQKRIVAQKPAPQGADAAAADNGVGSQELTTKHGDTLSAIARESQVEGVSLDQMLVSLYENNKDAFVHGNMNRLKVGKIIKVPTKEALTAIDPKEAKKIVRIHSADWNAYRNALAGNVSASAAVAEAEKKQSTSGKIATAEDKAAPVKTGPQDVVKLSAGEQAGKATNAKVVALQEDATAHEKALKEAGEKAAALDKQVQDMKKLIDLKNQSMSDLQKNAEAKTKEAEAAKSAATETKPVAEVKSPLEVKPVEASPVAPSAVVAPEVKKVTAPPVVQAKAPVTEAPSFLESLKDSVDMTLLGGAAAIALLGVGWVFLRNKRKKDLDSFERGILTSGGLRANTVFGNTRGNASMSDTSFLTDFAQSADGSMIDTHDVDPIAEAEVYMAYGRDAQAEEILKDAILKEPKRYELHLKLLEIYAARKDTSAFEAISGELYTTLGEHDPTWAKVAVIGASMEPHNPLYDVSKIVALEAHPKQQREVSDMAVATDADFDFSLQDEALAPKFHEDDANSVVMRSFETAQSVEHETSFDLGSLDDSPSLKASEPASLVVADEPLDNVIDFDLGELVASRVSAPVKTHASTSTAESHVLNMPSSAANVEAKDTVIDFGVDFDLPDSAESHVADNKTALNYSTPNVVEDISFDFDLPDDASHPLEAKVAKEHSDITFDLPKAEESKVATTEAEPLSAKTNKLEARNNFFTISLDLSNAESELPVDKVASNVAAKAANAHARAAETSDVNVKLDLVEAYIDMGDKEGAHELLQEVIKEGSAQQLLRAKQLLANLT